PELRPIDPTVRRRQLDAMEDVLAEITIVRQSADLKTQQERLNALAAAPGVQRISIAGQAALLELSPERYTAITDALRAGLASVLSGPILEPSDAPDAIRKYIANVDTREFDRNEETALTEVLLAFV